MSAVEMMLPIEMPIASRAVSGAQEAVMPAFEELMRLHERRVLGLALRLTGNLADAQDVAQEVFLKLHRNLRALAGGEAVAPWLRRVTVNACLDLGRRGKASRLAPLDGLTLIAPAPDAEALMTRQEQRDQITAALAHLGERERAALVLRELEGLSTAEVAELLGSAEATVRVQVAKARLKLRELLKELR